MSDPLPEVRIAAATTFDSLHSTVGVRALDDILPPLLKQLVCILLVFKSILVLKFCLPIFKYSCNPILLFQSDPVQSEYTLDGLRQVMAIKSKVVLPYLVPQVHIHY